MNSFTKKLNAYKALTRMDKPIGTYLLLWPTFWALWVAFANVPNLYVLWVFTLGVFLMRSAGCVINDFADRKVDGQVKRTEHRPIVSGLVSPREALIVFSVLILMALSLVLTLDVFTIQLSFVAIFLATLYPFLKRYTHLPQVCLGLAFSWGMIMAFAQAQGKIPVEAWLLFVTNVCWTIAYDTMYAMVDRDDDIKIGVKSTAILFGRYDKIIIAFLQIIVLILLAYTGDMLALTWPFQCSLLVVAALFGYQQYLIKNRNRGKCFQAFLNNHWVGLSVFLGIFLEYLPYQG